MAILDIFKKKKEVELPLPEPVLEPAPLPPELERFKVERPPLPTLPTVPMEAPRERDRIDEILQKLEMMDERLKVIEERLKR